MTLETVRAAKQALEDEGVYPSLDKIVARVGGSKRDIAALVSQLSGSPPAVEEPGPPADAAVPPAAVPDPSPDRVGPVGGEPAPLYASLAQQERTKAAELALQLRHT